jgi:lysophospholipase L1-like esterase
MVEKAREQGIKVILGTPTVIDEPEFERLTERIRYWIKSYARENNLPVIDFASAFFDENGQMRTDLLLADGGHPTIQGYQAMFRVIDPDIFKE